MLDANCVINSASHFSTICSYGDVALSCISGCESFASKAANYG